MNDDKILKYYNDYKSFIGCHALPDIIIEHDISKSKINVDAFVDIKTVKSESPILYVNDEFFSDASNDHRSTLYHEFTHIYDANIRMKDIDDIEILKKIMGTYSEFHATQVMTVCMLNYSHYFDIAKNKFPISQTIRTNEGNSNAGLYLAKKNIEIITLVNKPRKLDDNSGKALARECFTVKNFLFYYLGIYNIFKNYSQAKIGNYLLHFEDSSQIICNIYKALCDKKYQDVILFSDDFYNMYSTKLLKVNGIIKT